MPIVLRHDFGIIGPKQTYTHKFVLRNNTSHNAKLTTILNTCSCTVASPSSFDLAKGGEIIVPVSYKSPADYTNSVKRIQVHTDQGRELWYELEIESQVRPVLSVSAGQVSATILDFGRFRSNALAFRSLRVDNYGVADWTNLKVGAIPHWVEVGVHPVEFAPSIGARQSWDLSVEISPDLGTGSYSGAIELESVPTDPADCPNRATLTVSAIIDEGVRVTPPQLFFPSIQMNTSSIDSVVVDFGDRDDSTLPADLDIQHSLGSQLNVTTNKIGPGRFKVSVALTPATRGVIRSTLQIQVATTRRQLSVPLIARVTE